VNCKIFASLFINSEYSAWEIMSCLGGGFAVRVILWINGLVQTSYNTHRYRLFD